MAIATSNECFAFSVWVDGVPSFGSRIVNHRTAGKAKAYFLADLQDHWPEYGYTDLRVSKVGPCHSSKRFIHNARYRGLPDVRCGDRCRVGTSEGVIVGHDMSANFNVLFDDDALKYASEMLSVHPQEMELIK